MSYTPSICSANFVPTYRPTLTYAKDLFIDYLNTIS